MKNYEFKAKVEDWTAMENKLKNLHPVFKGLDHQTDTYFRAKEGRLKIREGNIESSLIFYKRNNIAGTKKAEVILYPFTPNADLKKILSSSMEILTVVEKTRKIYFLDNVKFHFDQVKGLGSFIEVEALDPKGNLPLELLKEQCQYYANYFGIDSENFKALSYSDMIIQKYKSN